MLGGERRDLATGSLILGVNLFSILLFQMKAARGLAFVVVLNSGRTELELRIDSQYWFLFRKERLGHHTHRRL